MFRRVCSEVFFNEQCPQRPPLLLHDRLKVQLSASGKPPRPGGRGFSLGLSNDDLLLIVRRVEALGKFLDTEDGKNLLAGYQAARRTSFATRRRSPTKRYAGAIDAKLLSEPPRKRPSTTAIAAAVKDAAAAIARRGFRRARWPRMAKLRAPVDAFFEHVRVNADDAPTRANRLRLLNHIREATQTVADFSRVEG